MEDLKRTVELRAKELEKVKPALGREKMEQTVLESDIRRSQEELREKNMSLMPKKLQEAKAEADDLEA